MCTRARSGVLRPCRNFLGGSYVILSQIPNEPVKLENYLLPKPTMIQLAKFIFHSRHRMLNLKTNYKKKTHTDLLCNLCKDPTSEYSQQHLLQCALRTDNQVSQLDGPEYDDLFFTTVKKQIAMTTQLAERCRKRKDSLNKK